MPIVLQFVFKPVPGSDLTQIIEHAKVVSKLWQKHGAKDASLWTVYAGEMGNMVFTVPFENYSEYGKCDLLSEISTALN